MSAALAQALAGSAATPTLTREGARQAARDELSDPRYHTHDPAPVAQLIGWFDARVQDVLNRASQLTGGSTWGLFGLLVALVAVIVLIRLRIGPMARRSAGSVSLDGEPGLSAADHRRAADGYAEAGRWAEAIRERMRAIAAELEHRTILAPRPGRTAHELAAEAGAALPGTAATLHGAAETFDAIWYGNRPGTRGQDAELRQLDAALARARPAAGPGSRDATTSGSTAR